MRVTVPSTKEDFEKYYSLRYEVLRKPWNQPKGSEHDEADGTSFHAMIKDAEGRVLAVGRLHLNNPEEAQVRYMAVDENWRGQKLGAMVLAFLEKEASRLGARRVILQARDKALEFYKQNGYSVVEETFLMYDSIQHYLMLKLLKQSL